MPNRLQFESSPYLLQHAQNPVDWYPWGNEAFEKARNENKPVLVSIGYAACHWCHVMEHESFEDLAVAGFMNENFVNIKVDREEHPDVDHLYMDALQAMSGAGGWPLNMFVTTDRKPFYGGTYFPLKSMYGRSSWMEILQGIKAAWHEKPEEIQLQSNQMITHLKQASIVSLVPSKEQLITLKEVDTIADNLLKQADTVWGGFGAAPKFPATGSIQYLLEYYHFNEGTEMAGKALEQALLSLDKMIEGGIYDQIGGGFSRYSTDKEWLVPHFEKMLYDNALLISVLSSAYHVSKNEKYRTVIVDTIAFCNRELRVNQHGGFYCALDADSEGIEGKFYTWTWELWTALLPEAHPALMDYFGIKEDGNWEHTNILNVATGEEDICRKYQLTSSEWNIILDNASELLFAKRAERIRPGTDDKILLSWNALMNTALVDAGIALNQSDYLKEAKIHMDWMLQHFKLSEEEALGHVYKNGLKDIPAKLDDYAYLIKALHHLASSCAEPAYILEAEKWMKTVDKHFLCEDKTFYYFSADLQQDILVRKVELYDGATPSANAIMMENLEVMGNLMEHSGWLEQSEAMLLAQAGTTVRYPASFARWGTHLQRYVKGLKQLVVAGSDADEILQKWYKYWHPEIFAIAAKEAFYTIPAMSGKWIEGKTVLYLCKDFACLLPVERMEDLNLG